MSLPSWVEARPAPAGVVAPSYYQRALDRFHRGDCSQALDLLDHVPADAGVDPRTRADLLNLRGEIYLRQGKLDKARAQFAEVLALNPGLWKGRFNLAEVAFEQHRYADSQREFASLAGGANRFDHQEERALAESRMELSAQRLSSRADGAEVSGSARMAVMQLLPARAPVSPHRSEAPARPGSISSPHRPPAPSSNPAIASQSIPPAPLLAPAEDETDDIAPGLLARKRPAPKPSPSPTPADDSTPPGASASPAASAAVSAATPAPSATPSADPAKPAFLQRYESAYIKFLEKDFAGARALLNEADAIQANQPASIDLRNKIFSYYYKIAYGKYSDKDYTGAQTSLDDADSVEKDQPDSLNLRGLIYSRQRVFDQAEVMFKKAVQADPSFWAAKFNMAELPFTYRNYTVARSRYEQLLSETDATKQPREAELTQFKVFLTLLLEGKESAARAFMDHFSFTGSTPARYYCQAALDFYAGSTDKAAESIAEARKDFPAQIEAIFADSFYRVGWLTDPNRGAAVASSSSSPAEAPEPPVSPSPSLAGSSPSGGPTTAEAKAPTPTPMMKAAASPSATPVVSATPSVKPNTSATPAPTATATPAPTATATPAPTATAKPTVTATPAPTVTATPAPTATATPAPTATATPAPTATVKPTVTATPAPTATVKPTVTATPAPTATVKPTATATPAPTATIKPTVSATPEPTVTAKPTVTATPAPTATAKPAVIATLSPTPTAQPSPTPTPVVAAATSPEPTAAEAETPSEATETEHSPQEDLIRLFALLLVPLYLIGSWFYVVRRALAIKAEKRKPGLHYGGRKRSPDDSDTPR